MLIGIKSCVKDRERGCHDAIRNSWAKYLVGADLRFFVGGPSLADDEVSLDVPDDYASLPHKVKAMSQWALRYGYSRVFFCDNDTFVHPVRLMTLLQDCGDYYGRFYWYSREPWATSGPFRFAFGGTGYSLSRRAMNLVAGAEVDRSNEDEWIGYILSHHAIHKYEGNMERFERYAAWHYTKGLYSRWPKYDPASKWMEAMTSRHIEGKEVDALEPLDVKTFPTRITSIGKTNPILIQGKIFQLLNTATSQEMLVSLAATIEIEQKPLKAVTLVEWKALAIAYGLLGMQDLSKRCLTISES